LADNLDILVFLDIGMTPITTQMAGLRLAPIQCLTWGHPITSGIPTIDYFLSSELMEPENCQTHYTEKLILLPKISICYPQPKLPQKRENRSFFQLPSEAIIVTSGIFWPKRTRYT
jgi:predicted O-linked N-acetylglucosamine transferase (SPINDLY family)